MQNTGAEVGRLANIALPRGKSLLAYAAPCMGGKGCGIAAPIARSLERKCKIHVLLPSVGVACTVAERWPDLKSLALVPKLGRSRNTGLPLWVTLLQGG
jgi:hypothetical protein